MKLFEKSLNKYKRFYIYTKLCIFKLSMRKSRVLRIDIGVLLFS